MHKPEGVAGAKGILCAIHRTDMSTLSKRRQVLLLQMFGQFGPRFEYHSIKHFWMHISSERAVRIALSRLTTGVTQRHDSGKGGSICGRKTECHGYRPVCAIASLPDSSHFLPDFLVLLVPLAAALEAVGRRSGNSEMTHYVSSDTTCRLPGHTRKSFKVESPRREAAA